MKIKIELKDVLAYQVHHSLHYSKWFHNRNEFDRGFLEGLRAAARVLQLPIYENGTSINVLGNRDNE